MVIESAKPAASPGASEPPAEPPLEGRVLADRYEVCEQLGEGGIGVVHRAKDRRTGKPVALKVLRELYGGQRSIRKRFAREARALSSLDHPNVVAIVDSGLDDATPYLVMELLQGNTLSAVLAEEHTLTWERARAVFRELMDGLAYVHRQGLLHRDLKPGNVFLQTLDGGERVKLLDFGLVKFVQGPGSTPGKADTRLTKTGQLFGTPGYMPPEQLLGQSGDERSDIYSATLLLFEMLAGERPFSGSLSEIASKQLEGRVPTLQQVRPNVQGAPALQAWFEKGLQVDPKQRFASIDALREAFEALPDPPLSPRTPPRARDIARDDTLLQPPRTDDVATAAARVQVNLPSGALRSDPPVKLPLRRGPGLLLWTAVLLVMGGVGYHFRDRLPQQAQQALDQAVTTVASLAEPHEATPEVAEPERPENESNDPPSTRVGAKDPWRGSVPSHLREIRKLLNSGRPGNETTVATLRRHNRDYPNDPRGHLLLGHLYVNRGWQRDAVRQYEFAVLRQPSARGDSHMLKDLLGMHAGGAWKPASTLIVEAYGDEASRAVARLLNTKLEPFSKRRLENLAERLRVTEP